MTNNKIATSTNPNSTFCKFGFHDWSPWEKGLEVGTMQAHPFSKVMLPFEREFQRRICHRCGKFNRENI